MVAAVAASMGDTLIFDSNAPGGYTFTAHLNNATTLSKIQAGNWDYVVLQEQSQSPSYPDNIVNTQTLLPAHLLDSIIKLYNPCGTTVFYMTWGWKNGDDFCYWPPTCTYEGMDSLTNLRYRMMADSNNALLSPVGAVRHYIRTNYPSIELYQPDGSHPSVAGTYAAACSFYTTLFRKSATLITYNPGITATDAANIRTAAKNVVYDSMMYWHIGEYDPKAAFSCSLSGVNQISFTNNSLNASTYAWDFGDGGLATTANPVHTYTTTGVYTVRLIAAKCGRNDTVIRTIHSATAAIPSINDQDFLWNIFPNPATTVLTLNTAIAKPFIYEIWTVAGAIVQTGNTTSASQQINIEALPEGVYSFRLKDSKHNSLGQQRFIKAGGRN